MGHHLILGQLDDFITNETLEDTLDERYRQKLARLLVENKGYLKDEIRPRWELFIKAGNNKAVVQVDFGVILSDRVCMIIKYGPGSLVTRRRPALAASRLLVPYQVPVIVVTNGEDAEILNGSTKKVISSGLGSIPSKSELIKIAEGAHFEPISEDRAEMESRIVYAYEIDGSCPCDDTVCRLNGEW